MLMGGACFIASTRFTANTPDSRQIHIKFTPGSNNATSDSSYLVIAAGIQWQVDADGRGMLHSQQQTYTKTTPDSYQTKVPDHITKVTPNSQRRLRQRQQSTPNTKPIL
jgi:hypothetical protein